MHYSYNIIQCVCVFRYEVKCCEVVWAIRHDSICRTFVDEGAAEFFLPHLHHDTSHSERDDGVGPVKRTKYVYEKMKGVREEVRVGGLGSALGPDWQTGRQMSGIKTVCDHMTVT